MRHHLNILLTALLTIGLLGSANARPVTTTREVVGNEFMVVSDSPLASQIGADILQQGGNAVDAAVAVGFALAVVWPEAGNIGGGGFMLVDRDDQRPPTCIDYRETAPLAVTENVYEIDESRYTARMVGTPGTVRGLAMAQKKYGKLPWRKLVVPAAQLAREGFVVDAALARSLNHILSNEEVATSPRCAELRRVYGKANGQPWRAGDQLKLADLATTLQSIADDGPESFYHGAVAKLLLAEMKRDNGLITAADLKRYRAVPRACVHATYRGFDVYGAALPSSGGICLAEALNILEQTPKAKYPRQSADQLHLLAETLKRVFADRARHLGDADFVEIPKHLTTKKYAAQLAANIEMRKATPSAQLAPKLELVPEGNDTTHYSIVDADGMAVANTYTLESSWGSRIVVRGGGFLLNNQMGDFNWRRGRTTRLGHIGTPANLIAPGKRMLSSQSPTIVCQNGQVVLVTGSPGGRSIISTVLQIIVNHIDYDLSPRENIALPRMHHQWFPDKIYFESAEDPSFAKQVADLKQRGHEVIQTRHGRGQGAAHTIWIDPNSERRTGVADVRRGGQAIGK